ncbi:MAG: threonine synthase [Bacteroidales bacterium]|jgi:threonine synthase|nr:threonine synthase [Bacteroidales bacterium]
MEPVKYYSTNLKADEVTFNEALLKGLAPDKGLYMPKEIPVFTKAEIDSFSQKEYYEIAFEVARKFLIGQINDDELLALVKDAYNYSIPLEKGFENKYIMRLDQGPTASFKDFAARMMGRLMQYYIKKEDRKLLILTATSGDTGSAIANAFYDLDNIQVVVLYPDNEVTDRQRKQMTTLGKNIKIISLTGKFDDCQALVKEAFSDSDLDYLDLSSANSINIGRLIPQIVYYFYSFSRLRKLARPAGEGNENDDVIFSVPSGNFGDMMGGVFAKRMGLPIKKFIISVNENDEFPAFLNSGDYSKIEPSKNCLSSAMNVGHPSNLVRLVALYGGVMNEKGEILKAPNMDKMRKDIFSTSVTDMETKEMIKEAYDKHNLILEPHGSVGWKGLMEYCNENNVDKDQLCISLETAHPAKFPDQIVEILKFDPELPASLEGLENKKEYYDNLDNNYLDFKKYLINNY